MSKESEAQASNGSLKYEEHNQYVDDPLQIPRLHSELYHGSPPRYSTMGIQSQDDAEENRSENESLKSEVQIKIEPQDLFDDSELEDTPDNIITSVNYVSTYCDVVIKEDEDIKRETSIDGRGEDNSQNNHFKTADNGGLGMTENDMVQFSIDVNILKEESDSQNNIGFPSKRKETLKYSCDLCSYKTKTLNTLVNHKLIHSNPSGTKLFVCKHCPYVTIHRSYIFLHERVHTGDKPYSCDICSIKFSQMRSLSRHKKAHTGNKPYICDICKRNFAQKYNLVKHLKTHAIVKPFSCDMCRYKFSDINSLNSHRSTHTDDRPFTCDLCQHKFKRRSVLIEHIRSHSGEKPYRCKKCNCRFSKKANLNNHQRIHTGEKPYTCDICHRNFSQRSNLISHRSTHPDAKPYSREDGKNFFKKIRITLPKKPKIQTDEKPHTCEICQRKFRQKCDLTKHLRIHTGDKPYTCDICECKFSQKGHLVTHKRTHTGEKPYICDICHRQFAQNSNLNVHKKTHSRDVLDIPLGNLCNPMI